jgi:hypothetical protein
MGCVGAWHRRQGERVTWNLYFGVGTMGFGMPRAPLTRTEPKNVHVDTIDDDHAHPMLRTWVHFCVLARDAC